MLICDGKTRATSYLEKAFIEAGGGDPGQSYGKEALGEILVEAIEFMDKHRPDILWDMYLQMERNGEVPDEYKINHGGKTPKKVLKSRCRARQMGLAPRNTQSNVGPCESNAQVIDNVPWGQAR